MTFRVSKFVGYFGAVLWTVVLSGCGPATYNIRQYVLQTGRPTPAAEAKSAPVLQVSRFTIDAAYAGKSFVYRYDEFDYEDDFYHQFLVPPAVMITDGTRLWLARSGLFECVAMLGSRLRPTYTLEGNITALYGDFRDEEAPQAVMELTCFFLSDEGASGTIRFAKVYRATNSLKSRSAEALAAALSRCFVEILEQLEGDLRQSLSSETE